MSCSDIIAIVNIFVSAGLGIWIATAINNGHTKERFLKDYFTNELNSIKIDCKLFFDEVCYDKKSATDIKIGFKLLSMRISAFENNLELAFKNTQKTLSNSLSKIQMDITGSDDFNNQFKENVVKFSAAEKNNVLESRSKLLTEFSKAIIDINKAKLRN